MALRWGTDLGRTYVKICGVTRVEDARAAIAAGADAIGLNFHPPSPRCITIDRAREIATVASSVDVFGVFVEQTASEIREIVNQVGLSVIQLHGDAKPELVAQLDRIPTIQAIRFRGSETLMEIEEFLHQARSLGGSVSGLLIDAYDEKLHGGTGKSLEWSALAGTLPPGVPWLLAGGLTPDNVAAAIAACHPNGVDTASGVESSPGVKDHAKIAAFVSDARSADRAPALPPITPSPPPPPAL